MAKRFNLRICRAIATTLQSCRSKDPSNLPQDPVPSFSRLSQVNAKRPNRCHSPSDGGLSENIKALDKEITVESCPEQFNWEKEEKWHVVAKVCQESTPCRKMYNSSASCGDSGDGDLTFSNPHPLRKHAAEKKKRRAKRNKRNVPRRVRKSTSSGDSGWFSCECGGGGGGHEETETLFSSSLTLSTDSSSEFNPHVPLNPIRKTQNSTANPPGYKRKLSKATKRLVLNPAAEDEIPARLSMFMKLTPCIVDGKIKESFAIVKRSENPYEDFKNSMIDMIVEKQMFEHKDLEQLLQCFLSLNSRHYHGIIIQAFYEIWDAIFSAEGSKNFSGSSLRRAAKVAPHLNHHFWGPPIAGSEDQIEGKKKRSRDELGSTQNLSLQCHLRTLHARLVGAFTLQWSGACVNVVRLPKRGSSYIRDLQKLS